MDKRKYNASGCLDLTAYHAVEKVSAEERDLARLNRLLAKIFRECDNAGFYVEERIVLKDKKTGKIWR